jgi:uncharacterized membrane protein
MRIYRAISGSLLTLLMVGAGTMHLINPGFFLKIMPPYLPFQQEAVLLSGLFEIGLGLLLQIPRFTRTAAWGIIALLIAVFPANIYVYQHQDLVPAPPIIHFLRLPLQALLIVWAWWHTKAIPVPPAGN